MFQNHSQINTKPVIVVGMGRSGTSYTSSLLHRCGINMGEKMLKANYWNKEGFFEDIRFFDFHIKWLLKFNLDPGFGAPQKELLNNEELIQDARELISSINPKDQWGFKDPRATGFIPLWKKIFPNCLFIFVYRSPIEVADSLIRKAVPLFLESPINIIKIWNQYNTIALEELKECNFICRHIDQIKSDPFSLVSEIASKGYTVDPTGLENIFVKESFSEHLDPYPEFSKILIQSYPHISDTYEQLLELSNYKTPFKELTTDEFLLTNWLNGRNLENYTKMNSENLTALKQANDKIELLTKKVAVDL